MLNVYTDMSWTYRYSYYLIATIEVIKMHHLQVSRWVGSLILIPPLCSVVYNVHIMRLLSHI